MRGLFTLLLMFFSRRPSAAAAPEPILPPPAALPTPIIAPVVPRMPTGKAGWVGLAISAIAGFEGLYTYAYRDPVGIPTICFGHIEDVHMGDRKTVQECKDLLVTDLPRYEAMVRRCIRAPMPDHRHAAIVSFTYNVGGGALCKSSVARKLNAGDVAGGCEALMLYSYAKGIHLPGLANRRKAERSMCLRED